MCIRDRYIGDYWTIGGINYRIAAFDYYYRTGDTSCDTHHVVLVPDVIMYTHVMNDTNITDGAYAVSYTHLTICFPALPCGMILPDIIKQVEADLAKSFRMEVRENKLYIEPYSDLIIKASFKPADNLAAFDPTKVPADEQGHRRDVYKRQGTGSMETVKKM